MLVTTDATWTAPKWPGPCVRVFFPEHNATPADIDAFRKRDIVFEFTRSEPGIIVLQGVLDRLDHFQQFAADDVLFSKAALSSTSLAAMVDRVERDPWLIEGQYDPLDGSLSALVLGRNVTGHPLFVTFFRNLSRPSALEPEAVVDSMKIYLGPELSDQEGE